MYVKILSFFSQFNQKKKMIVLVESGIPLVVLTMLQRQSIKMPMLNGEVKLIFLGFYCLNCTARHDTTHTGDIFGSNQKNQQTNQQNNNVWGFDGGNHLCLFVCLLFVLKKRKINMQKDKQVRIRVRDRGDRGDKHRDKGKQILTKKRQNKSKNSMTHLLT